MRYNLNFMRILAGEARGRKLHTPSGRGTRPTDSRTRETLFNILGDEILEARMLDLYAGSGSVGLEALSRGARFCTFIEQNLGAARAIRANLKLCRWDSKEEAPFGQVWQSSVKSALRRLEENEQRFDIIFADPPFIHTRGLLELAQYIDTIARLLHNVEESSEKKEGPFHAGLLVVQHQHRMEFALPSHFELEKARRVGESMLSFFRYIPQPATGFKTPV